MFLIFRVKNLSQLHLPIVLFMMGLTLFFTQCDSVWGSQPLIPNHHLTITLQPKGHNLTAQDIITFHNPSALPPVLELTLNQHLVIDEILLNNSVISLPQTTNRPQSKLDGQRIHISLEDLNNKTSSPTITIRYHGMIADRPQGTLGLRFTKPDKTTGYIGPEGVYLTSETQWYPTISETLATFQVESTVPFGWETVTQGKERSRVASQNHTMSKWDIPSHSEALTLVANRFVKQERIWNGITMATYLFPEDASLSEQYLDATAKYLDIYTKLLGPYPFSKFAVVENFFPAGIGLPSYTLLGNRIIKRGYTQPYSLGHEIVHSWFGNSVFNRFSTGNWVEGLTTYLANYYYEELHASADTSKKNRQHMMYEYNLYGTQAQEYPIRKFHHKESRIDNAIGYQKTAMLFHMLRQEVGDKNFFTSIRSLVKEGTGRHADWHTLQQIFNKTSGRDLSWFFEQWVERVGAPSIKILKTGIQEDRNHLGEFLVNMSLVQQKPHYRLRLPMTMHLADGTKHKAVMTMIDQEQTYKLSVPARPTRLVIDPEFMVLRRLSRSQIPPMLNAWVTDPKQRVILVQKNTEEEREAYQAVLHRLRAQDSAPEPESDIHASFSDTSVLLLGNPLYSTLAQPTLAGCGGSVELGENLIAIQGKKFEGPDIAWLISCPHPNNPNHVVSAFYGFSPTAISRVARLLFFYGWDSYLVFQNGRVLTRGLFKPSIKHLEVLLDAA